MLTILPYYDSYYKPYILDKDKNTQKSFKTAPSKERQYFMNKALNDNVKSYMFEMSYNFNGLKNISNELSQKLQTKYMTRPVKEEIEDNIENFTSTYNRFIGFLDENAPNSKKFKNISANIKRFSANNIKVLNKMGISIDSNGFLSVKEDNDLITIQKDKDTLKAFYSKIYNGLCNYMKDPMSKHMEFKDFSFYFNYANDYNSDKSFALVEQGILVDIGV